LTSLTTRPRHARLCEPAHSLEKPLSKALRAVVHSLGHQFALVRRATRSSPPRPRRPSSSSPNQLKLDVCLQEQPVRSVPRARDHPVQRMPPRPLLLPPVPVPGAPPCSGSTHSPNACADPLSARHSSGRATRCCVSATPASSAPTCARRRHRDAARTSHRAGRPNGESGRRRRSGADWGVARGAFSWPRRRRPPHLLCADADLESARSNSGRC